ncbi:MAG: adenylate/guanylate cyclase domain-containing protein [Alphaproteobacteria bacterium]
MTEANLIARLRSYAPPQLEEASRSNALMQALEADKREGLKMAVRARTAALTVIAVFVIAINWRWDALYWVALIAGFMVIGWAQVRFGRVGRSRLELVLIVADLALMTVVAVVPNPFLDVAWPTAMQYHFNIFLYFFVLLAGASLAYSYRTFLAYGIWTTILWTGGAIWVWWQAPVFADVPAVIEAAIGPQPLLIPFLDPNNVNPIGRTQELIVFLIVAGILAVNGRRTYQLVVRQAEAARGRANLARHFAPTIVDQLAERDDPLGEVREQPVAVLFADIVGFTKFAEHRAPDDVVATLRAFHERLERAVFDNHGTLDKFLGDGLMATFGTPEAGPEDAGNALACAFDMQAEMDAWNAERATRGEPAIALSVGLHYGEVVLGDIGSSRRLEFAVLGDAVNVASRLESLTRPLDVAIAASDDLVAAVGAQDGGADLVKRLSRAGPRRLRGRDDAIEVWTAPRAG